jgi:hypothetical protein
MKSALALVDALALLMLAAMSDLEPSTRLLVAGIILANLLLLVGARALATRPARWGAAGSLAGYAGAVSFWLILALGCGIEYYKAGCDAVVTPLITASVVLGLASLPAGRLFGLFRTR